MTEKIMAGVNSYSMFVISLIISTVTTALFIKLFLLDDEQTIDFFLIYNLFAFERTLENLQTVLSDFLNSLKYLEYCEELMSIPQEEGYDLVPAGQSFQFKEKVESNWIAAGKINFHDFSVRYRSELDKVLKGVTMEVREREKIGVVGRTGSGKSTTILSLMRILQIHEGTINIDGVDIYNLDLQTLRAGFSVILQEHFLFTGTVR
jgi:ABC-type multidrug transport system fused ATPase/permease subunit